MDEEKIDNSKGKNENDDDLETNDYEKINEAIDEGTNKQETISMNTEDKESENLHNEEDDNDITMKNNCNQDKDDNEESSIEIKKDNEVEKDKKLRSNKNKRNITIFIGIIIFTIIFITNMISTVSKYNQIVYPGVSIYGEDVSKLDKNQLNRKLDSIQKQIKNNKIFIKTKNTRYDIDIKDLVKEYNKDKLCNKVLNYGKSKNIFQKYKIIVMKPERNYKFDININKDDVKEIVSRIAKETSIEPKNSSVTIDGSKIGYRDGKEGIKLDEKLLINEIYKAIKEMDQIDGDIKIDAKYKSSSPKINVNELKKVDTKISEYSTYYGGGNGRGRNIENAARKLDDMILMPGDEFSYEDSIGPVTADNGYTYASVIINGEITDGIGGGVCQVSSTMYNAQLKAGLLPTERRNHSKPVDYVPRGLDATLATGSINYKFKNTYEYPIVINAYTSGGKLYIEFWSNKDATKGIEYKAESYVSGNIANSYLYGYDKDGKRVYEKHIDTSIYR